MDYDPEEESGTEENDETQVNTMNLSVNLRSVNPMLQQVFLVFQSNLEKLMTHCPGCHMPILEITDKTVIGTQVVYTFSCLNGCNYKWYSQPTMKAVKGILNFLNLTDFI